jgi:glycosyltransferase involved in cell wall biosynthesis
MNDHKEKISVIIPCYNGAKFLRRTISSVKKQTYTNWEIIAVDDKSSDNTVDVLKKEAAKEPRMKLIFLEKNSGGPATPKNVGVEKATGSYIAFLDQDDEWVADKLEKQLAFFLATKNEKLAVVYCSDIIKDNETGTVIRKWDATRRGNVLEDIAGGNFILTCSCVMARTEIFRKVGKFDAIFKISDDWDMWLQIAEAGYDFDFVPEYLVNYFVHGNNACYGQTKMPNRLEFGILCEKHKNSTTKHNSLGLGYYYYMVKDYSLARKYLAQAIFSKKYGPRERFVSFAYILISFFPWTEKSCYAVWKRVIKPALGI